MWRIISDKGVQRIKEDAAKEAIENYKKQQAHSPAAYIDIDNTRHECSVLLDFNNPHISIFSVERMNMNTADERTIVGYVFLNEQETDASKKKQVKEWTLYISRRQHNALVELYAKRKSQSAE